MKKSLASAALFTAVVLVPGMANAADLLVDPPIIQAPEVITQPAGGWYLRGDITYDVHSMENPTYSVPAPGELSFASADLEDSFDLSLGIGYQINENFRVDLTGEYVFSSDFNGTTGPRPIACSNAGAAQVGTSCSSTDTTSYTAFKVLANAYVDLGNFSGLTPYVGAGIGGAYVSWDGLTNTEICVDGAGACGGLANFVSNHPGTESWRFAYALHAGFAYDLTSNMKLDLGYSYSHISGGDMFGWLGAPPVSGTQGYDHGIDSHVFRAGLRYQIW